MQAEVVPLQDLMRSIPREGESWKHFNGETCRIVGVGEHSETNERLVIYRRDAGSKIWVRPLKMFMGKANGGRSLRFEKVGSIASDFISGRDPGDECEIHAADVGC